MKVVCDHVSAECLKDGCHHARPHEEVEPYSGLRGCRQMMCNGVKGEKVSYKVFCVAVKK